MRKCKDCGGEFDVENFPLAGTIKGVRYYRYRCTICYSKFKQKRKDSIKEWYFNLKKEMSCAKCGISDFRVLDFDHLDRDVKSFTLSEGYARGFSKEKMLEEMKKCQVLCANCHRIKTFEENGD